MVFNYLWGGKDEFFQRVWNSHIKRYYILYLMALPTIITGIIFSYAPMFGLVMAFQSMNKQGFWK